MEPVSKEQAIFLNQKWYYTGVLCQNGHLDKRYVNTGICYACKRERNKECNKRNPETLKTISKRSYYNTPVAIRNARRKEWAIKNRERSRNIKRKSHEKHKEKYSIYDNAYNERMRSTNPGWRLSRNISKAIWECLKNNKNNKSWLSFVNYNKEQLMAHLESKFNEHMNWNNYGSYWHLDHKKPLSWFNLETEFHLAWALDNLQPLEAKENLSKNNRYEG